MKIQFSFNSYLEYRASINSLIEYGDWGMEKKYNRYKISNL